MEIKPPKVLVEYVESKLKNGRGRKHFMKIIAESGRNPLDVAIDILQSVWINGNTPYDLAKKYNADYYQIYRVLKDLEPFKAELEPFLMEFKPKKVFYNKELDYSDYETVKKYILYAKAQGLLNYKRVLQLAEKVWKFLNRKDPKNWTLEDCWRFLGFLKTLSQKQQFCVAIRSVAPHLKQDLRVKWTKSVKIIELFAEDVKQILNYLYAKGMYKHALVFKLHISLGCREGSQRKAGFTWITWEQVMIGNPGDADYHYIKVVTDAPPFQWNELSIHLDPLIKRAVQKVEETTGLYGWIVPVRIRAVELYAETYCGHISVSVDYFQIVQYVFDEGEG